MRIIRVCAYASCGKQFIAIKKKHLYCRRKCFKKSYREKMKEQEKAFPSWRCPKCKTLIQLEFNPKKHYEDWANFKCSQCGTMAATNEFTESFSTATSSASSFAGEIPPEIIRRIMD